MDGIVKRGAVVVLLLVVVGVAACGDERRGPQTPAEREHVRGAGSMEIRQAEQMLRDRVAKVKERTVGSLLRTMINFYRDARFQALPLAENGDGLLLQWGVYDWGQGRAFEFDLTRQFFVAGEDEPYHLSMTMRFDPTPALTSLSASNRWCFTLDELRGFEEFMMSSPPYRALASKEPDSLEIRFENV